MDSNRRGWRWTNFPVPEAHLIVGSVGVVLGLIWPVAIGREGPWSWAVGTVLIVSGGGLMTWATVSAGDVRVSDPNRIVTEGPYSFSRHPMYVGWTLAYLGLAVMFDWGWLLVLFPVLAIWINRDVLREEERMLERFDTAYQDYQRHVRRYL